MKTRAYFDKKVKIIVLYKSLENHDVFGDLRPISVVGYLCNWIGLELGLVYGEDFIWNHVGSDGLSFSFDDREELKDKLALFKMVWG